MDREKEPGTHCLEKIFYPALIPPQTSLSEISKSQIGTVQNKGSVFLHHVLEKFQNLNGHIYAPLTVPVFSDPICAINRYLIRTKKPPCLAIPSWEASCRQRRNCAKINQMEYLRIKRGAKKVRANGTRYAIPLVITKTKKYGHVISEQYISRKQPVLITGAHDAGKTRWVIRLHQAHHEI